MLLEKYSTLKKYNIIYFLHENNISKYFSLHLWHNIKYIIMKLRVKEICKSKGLLMANLASSLGIARVNLTKTINGNPTIETLERIAEALNVSVTELFEQPEKDYINCPNCGATLMLSKKE